MRRTVITFALFIGAALAPDASAGPLDPYASIGCWSDLDGCGDARKSAILASPLQLAASPDGKTLYSRIGGGGIAWSVRDTATGTITPTACMTDASSIFSGCTSTGTVVGESTDIVVSPDGGNVYQATDARLVVFNRDAATGALAYRECFGATGDGACTNVAGINQAFGVAVSPDGANVYVASRGGAGYLQVFDRGSGGHLTDAGCFHGGSSDCGAGKGAAGVAGARRVAVTPDGTGVYVVANASGDGSIAWFSRATGLGHALTYGGCLGPAPCPDDATSFSEPLGLAIPPDGHSVYVATAATLEAQLHHFERGIGNILTGQECWTDPSRTSFCGAGRTIPGIGGAQSVTATNTQVFVAGHDQSAVAALTRDAATGALTAQGCVKAVSGNHECGDANELAGLGDIRSVELSPDAATLYAGAVAGISAFQAPGTGGPGGGTGGPGGGTGGPGGGGSTPVAPVIGGAKLSSRVLRTGRTLRLTVTLDRAASIRAVVGKLVAGRRSKGRCVKPAKKLRRARRCTRVVRKRTLTAQGRAGANTLTVKAKGLARGRYRIAVTATADGLTSAPRTLTFTRRR
jgi:DNA-binding beta-propeller fold protein YncE